MSVQSVSTFLFWLFPQYFESILLTVLYWPVKIKHKTETKCNFPFSFSLFSSFRVASMPNTGVEEEYYRLRHFSITGKGVINRGDSLKSRRSRSNNSVASSNSRYWFKNCLFYIINNNRIYIIIDSIQFDEHLNLENLVFCCDFVLSIGAYVSMLVSMTASNASLNILFVTSDKRLSSLI